MNISLAIADTNRRYVEKLSEVLQQYHDLTISLFTNAEKLQVALDQTRFDVLLFDPDISPERLSISGVKLAVCLYSDGCANMGLYPDCAKILKYQRISNIYKNMLREYADKAGEYADFGNRTSTKLIGVYSPVHRIGKTRFAIRMGKQLSQKFPVLYLNLEGNAGGNYYFPEDPGHDIGDLLYYMR